jgi:hypothetical protein
VIFSGFPYGNENSFPKEIVPQNAPYRSLEEKRKQSLKRADSGTGPYADLMRYGMILYQAGSIRIPDSL